MKQAIVTGPSGFLGSRVVDVLISDGVKVQAVVHRKAPTKQHPLLGIMDGGLLAIPGNVSEYPATEAIFHMARPTMPILRSWGRSLAGMYAWWLNRRLIGRLATLNKRPPLYFAGGTLSYGYRTKTVYEDAHTEPISYARQYHTGELPLLKAIRTGSYPVILFRLPWLLGPGSWFQWFYLDNIREHGVIPVFGNGRNIMSILNANDAARIMCAYAGQKVAPGIYHVFNPRAAITQYEFAEMVCNLFDCKAVHYRQLYPFTVERAVLEAFTSNLQPDTNYPELLHGYNFTTPEETLKQIKAAFEK